MARKIKRINGANTCLTDCVAYFFRIDSRKVPFFIGYKDFVKALKTFFLKRGYVLTPRYYRPSLLKKRGGLQIVQGLSPRSRAKNLLDPRALHHAVIYHGKKRHFDPSPDKRFLKGRPIVVWVAKAKK